MRRLSRQVLKCQLWHLTKLNHSAADWSICSFIIIDKNMKIPWENLFRFCQVRYFFTFLPQPFCSLVTLGGIGFFCDFAIAEILPGDCIQVWIDGQHDGCLCSRHWRFHENAERRHQNLYNWHVSRQFRFHSSRMQWIHGYSRPIQPFRQRFRKQYVGQFAGTVRSKPVVWFLALQIVSVDFPNRMC